jgi:hypothetical protein
MAKTETIKKALEKAREQIEAKRTEWSANHRTAMLRMTQAIQCLDRILNDEQLMDKQGKEYFQATTPVTGKTKLEKAND